MKINKLYEKDMIVSIEKKLPSVGYMYILLNLSKRAIKRYQELPIHRTNPENPPSLEPNRKTHHRAGHHPIPNRKEKTHPI
jgi:hypothetical protein